VSPLPSNSAPQAVSISIVSYDSPSQQLATAISSLGKAIEKLAPAGEGAAYSLTLVDNSESGAVDTAALSAPLAKLEALGCSYRLIAGHGNVGYGAGQNLAFASAHHAIHVFMNPDVELDSQSLTVGLDYLADNPDVAMVSPHALDDAGNKQFLCKRYPTVFDFFLRGFMPASVRRLFDERLARFEMRELSDSEPSKDIPIISGCFMLCRSALIEKAAGFDPDYFLYFEDFDLSLRVGELASLAYLPAMRIRHGGGGSARKGARHIKMFLQSARRFFSSHGWRWFKQT
jgi:GT2 family glycosyltransferase